MAPSHVDLSVLWVPIMPETSKLGPAMEEAGKSATDSFDKGTSGLGDKLHDSFTKATGKIKDVFHKAGSEATDSMADGVKEGSSKIEDALGDAGEKATGRFRETAKGLSKQLVDAIGPDTKQLLGDRLEETVTGAMEGVLGDNAKWVGKLSHSVADWGFDELKNKLGGVKEAADKTRKAFADFGNGDTTGGVSKLVDGFDRLGMGVKDLPEPMQKVLGDISDAKGAAEEFAGVFKDLPGKIGVVGTAISDLAGPIGIAAAAAMTIWNGLPGTGGGLKQILASPTVLDTSPENLGLGVPNSVSVQTPASNMALPGQPQPVAASSIPAAGQGHEYIATQGSLDPFAALLPPGMAPPDLSKPAPFAPVDMPDGALPSLPKPTPPPPPPPPPPAPAAAAPSSFVNNMPSTFSSRADLHAGGNRVANLYAVAESLAGTPYSQSLRNDCSGMVSKLATAALGMAPSAAFSTQNEGEWLMSHGFQPGLGGPNDLNIGWYNHGSDPNSGHTAATLPGGVNAESGGSSGAFTLGGSVGATSSQFDQHAHLAMGGSSGNLGIPTGAQHDPLYIMPADGGQGGGSSTQDQAQQLGSGLVNGILQEFGLDGSVFKSFGGSSNPLHFGITKLATGLVNAFAGGGEQSGGSLGGGGSILPGLGSLIPHGSVPTGPGGSQSVRTGETVNHNYYGNTGPQLNVTQNGVQSPTEDLHAAANGAANRLPAMGTAPNSGMLPATGTG